MEHRTKFDLDQNMAHWKTSLSQSQKMTYDNIEELSDHLYSEIDALRELGLDKEEAFLVAKKRIGSVDSIVSEFKKVNNQLLFIHEIIPYIKGILIFIAFSLVTDILGNWSLVIGLKTGINIPELNIIVFVTLSLLAFSFFYLLYHRFKNKNTIFPIKIPTLVIVVILAGVLTPISSNVLFKMASPADVGIIFTTLGMFKISFLTLLLVFSCIAVIYIKKKGLKIAD